MSKLSMNPSPARRLVLACFLGGIAVPNAVLTAQDAVTTQTMTRQTVTPQTGQPSMHLPAYDPARPGPIAVFHAIEPVREATGERTVNQPHFVQSAQRSTTITRTAPAGNAPVVAENINRPQVIRITGQDGKEKEIEVQVVVQEAAANHSGSSIQRRGNPNKISDTPVYDGQPIDRKPTPPPTNGLPRTPAPMHGMRPPGMVWTPARGEDLDDQAEELDEVFETEIVSRMLELMKENFELKAQMKVKEIETRSQMEIAELKLGFAREQLEVKNRELDRRAEAFEQRARELDEQHEHLAHNERGLDEMREEAELQLHHAEERFQEAEQHIRETEERHRDATETLRRELEEAMQARAELSHRTRAMSEQIGELERQLAKALEQLEKAKTSKAPAKRAEEKKPTNKKPKRKSDDN